MDFTRWCLKSGRLRPGTMPLILVITIFGTVYLLISLLNHHFFRTYALDLGMFNQAVYSLSRFRPALYTLDITGVEMSLFAAHWSPVIFLYVPFYYLFGDYTLLIIQVASVLIGGFGVYCIALKRGLSTGVSLIVLVFSTLYGGIYSALAFDFHNNVIAAMAVPWFIYFLSEKRGAATYILFVIILSTRENMSLWMVFILAGLLVSGDVSVKMQSIRVVILMLVALLWFIAVNSFILPSIQPAGTGGQLSRFSHFGSSYPEVTRNIISHPFNTLKLFLYNTTADPVYDGIKQELLLMILASGGIALLVRPAYLIMIIPVYLQKVLSNDYALWGINYHYSVEFVPVLALAVVDTLLLIKRSRWRAVIALAVTLAAIFATVSVTIERRSKWYRSENVNILSKEHYRSVFSWADLQAGIEMIPDDMVVSVSTELAPHLSSAMKLYHFPVIKDASYIIVLKTTDKTFPVSPGEYLDTITFLRESDRYNIIYESEDLVLFRVPLMVIAVYF